MGDMEEERNSKRLDDLEHEQAVQGKQLTTLNTKVDAITEALGKVVVKLDDIGTIKSTRGYTANTTIMWAVGAFTGIVALMMTAISISRADAMDDHKAFTAHQESKFDAIRSRMADDDNREEIDKMKFAELSETKAANLKQLNHNTELLSSLFNFHLDFLPKWGQTEQKIDSLSEDVTSIQDELDARTEKVYSGDAWRDAISKELDQLNVRMNAARINQPPSHR